MTKLEKLEILKGDGPFEISKNGRSWQAICGLKLLTFLKDDFWEIRPLLKPVGQWVFDDAHDWADSIAMDKNGDWYYYGVIRRSNDWEGVADHCKLNVAPAKDWAKSKLRRS